MHGPPPLTQSNGESVSDSRLHILPTPRSKVTRKSHTFISGVHAAKGENMPADQKKHAGSSGGGGGGGGSLPKLSRGSTSAVGVSLAALLVLATVPLIHSKMDFETFLFILMLFLIDFFVFFVLCILWNSF